jgi:hypothetical protein
MLVYLFRDQDRSSKFGYSTDVTGRNLPRQMAGSNWSFVKAASREDLSDCEEAMRHLRRHGFYVFDK